MGDNDPRFKAHMPKPWQAALACALTGGLYAAIAIGMRTAADALGYPGVSRGIWYGALLLFLAYIIAGAWMNSSNKGRRARGEPMRMFGWGFWVHSAGHAWQDVSAEGAELQWTRMRRLPRGGHLLGAKRCAVCPATYVECEDASGERCLIVGGLGEQLWTWWLVGAFFVSMPFMTGGAKPLRRLSLFERVECRWRLLDADEARTLWIDVSDGPFVENVSAWRCADCGAQRLDADETFGERMIFFRSVPGYAVKMTVIGLFVVWCEQPFAAAPPPDALSRAA